MLLNRHHRDKESFNRSESLYRAPIEVLPNHDLEIIQDGYLNATAGQTITANAPVIELTSK